jgi:tetratricopeptide (TPR) repeat protein
MNGTRKLAVAALAAALALTLAGGLFSVARAQDAAKQPYTMAEYNAYQAAVSEKNPAQQIRQLDDFVLKYPNSALLVYIYQAYIRNYNAQRTFPKVIDNADKLLALGDKADAAQRYEAAYARAFAFTNMNVTDKDQALKARAAALLGLNTLDQIKKPETLSDDDFNKQVLIPAKVLFNYTAASAAMTAKNYTDAAASYKSTLVLTPNEPVTWFRLGVAYISMAPPQHLDGFWALGRSVSLKGPTEAQVRTYLRRQMFNYQQPGCEPQIDAEMAELIALAGSTAERPASYKLPTSAELDAARKEMTIASVITDLKAGGDRGKVTWLASCGLEFPDVPGKLIESTPGADAVTLKIAFVASEEAFDPAKTPDMDVSIKLADQPGAARVEKDNPVRFTATLMSYDPDPSFMLHWGGKAMVNVEDIPEEKKAPVKKPVRRPPAKKPTH